MLACMPHKVLCPMAWSLAATMATTSCTSHREPRRPPTETDPPIEASTGVESLQRSAAAQLAQDDFSGVVVAVHRGATVVSVARGVLGAAGTPAVTPSTRFNIASAGKMFTAVAIAQLVDAGKLRFADQVGSYVPGLPPETAAITIAQLLTHTSGLGNFFSPMNLPTLQRARTATDLLPLIAADKPASSPGARFAYSNSGFALLGVVIERVSGEVYADYLRDHIFRPADMLDTSLDAAPLEALAQPLTAKTRDGGVGPLHLAPGATIPGSAAGGAFSSANDLEKFAVALLGHRLASPASTDALLAPKVQGPSADRAYGYGFGIKTRHARTWLGHNGGTLGANAELEFSIDGAWILVVLANRDPPSATRQIDALEDRIANPQS
jgi:D-alanyl-D-alanine carboxypeptidase